MKHLLLLLVTITLVACGGSKDKERDKTAEKSEKVYICTGDMSECYHEDPDCRGLARCSRDIEEITIEEAEDMGRRPCSFCYR